MSGAGPSLLLVGSGPGWPEDSYGCIPGGAGAPSGCGGWEDGGPPDAGEDPPVPLPPAAGDFAPFSPPITEPL